MKSKPINPTKYSYSQAFEVKKPAKLLFISGQIPESADGHIPENFTDQCLLAWANVEKQLKDANMRMSDLVKITIYLSDRKYREENYEIRKRVLTELNPAMTIIITGIYDAKWLLEIEAIAAT
ncbi:MAG: RidA family protein [Sphingobacteriales bacterium]|nr:RidA family protein [Sphingobacteriales bacterium]